MSSPCRHTQYWTRYIATSNVSSILQSLRLSALHAPRQLNMSNNTCSVVVKQIYDFLRHQTTACSTPRFVASRPSPSLEHVWSLPSKWSSTVGALAPKSRTFVDPRARYDILCGQTPPLPCRFKPTQLCGDPKTDQPTGVISC